MESSHVVALWAILITPRWKSAAWKSHKCSSIFWLATREPHALRKLTIGYVALVPVQAFSVIADFLKNLTDDPAAMAQLGWAPWHREVIAFCYQFGTLILPTVAPAIVWVLMHRRFLENFAGRRVG